MRIIITLIIASLLYSCSGKNADRDDLAVCTIKNKIILSEIEKFIDSTKGSKNYIESEFIHLGIFYDSVGTKDAKVEVAIKYLIPTYLDYGIIFLPCQKIKGKRVVLWRYFPVFCGADQIIMDSVFYNRMESDVYPQKERLDSIVEKIRCDQMKEGCPYYTLDFIIKDGVIVDSTYIFGENLLINELVN